MLQVYFCRYDERARHNKKNAGRPPASQKLACYIPLIKRQIIWFLLEFNVKQVIYLHSEIFLYICSVFLVLQNNESWNKTFEDKQTSVRSTRMKQFHYKFNHSLHIYYSCWTNFQIHVKYLCVVAEGRVPRGGKKIRPCMKIIQRPPVLLLSTGRLHSPFTHHIPSLQVAHTWLFTLCCKSLAPRLPASLLWSDSVEFDFFACLVPQRAASRKCTTARLEICPCFGCFEF